MKLFHVYSDPKPEGYYDPHTEPFGIYRQILDADWLLYILLPFLLIIIIAVLMIGWRVHEIPAHKADHKKMRQVELVSALTLLGLLEHWVWAVALFIAYMDWQAAEDWLVKILSRARSNEATSTDAPPATGGSHGGTPSVSPTPPVTASNTAPMPKEPVLHERVAPAAEQEKPA